MKIHSAYISKINQLSPELLKIFKNSPKSVCCSSPIFAILFHLIPRLCIIKIFVSVVRGTQLKPA